MPSDPTTITKLDELMTTIQAYDDPRRATAEWKQVYKLLQKTDLPTNRLTHVVGMRDLAQLAELLDQLRNPTSTPATPPDAPDAQTCGRAMRAFRKRLTLTRLDEESKISNHSPLTSGADSHMSAIVPPIEWPNSVWQELVRQGKLRYTGHGFYEQTNQQ